MSNLETSNLETRIPSFADLRAFARDGWRDASPQRGPFGDRHALDLPEGPVSAGRIALAAGAGSVTRLEADEYLIAVSGALTFTQGDTAFALDEGASIVLPRGASFDWRADAPVVLIYMRYANPTAENGTLLPIDETAPLEPSGAPLAELLIGPTPQCRNHTDYRSSDGEFMCGTWDSTPYHRRAMTYRHYELMHLLKGSVTFVDEAGRSGTFSQGDIFLVEQKAQCSWESTVDVAKVYAIYRPAA